MEAQHEYYGLEKNDPCVVHARGQDLKDLYARHKVAAIVRRDNPYLRFASPLKFYEAIGQNIPLLVTDGSLAADLVHEWNIGWVMREDLADFSAQQLVDEYGEKLAAITAIKAEHTWSRRAQSIARVLGAAELG
ncbi:MAG: hypothetical protein D6E12_18535 [Desulfovibrio sp.]|nr:MAG: hypothetical protein D6E12_18535 [Desulfovibrio sp.]